MTAALDLATVAAGSGSAHDADAVITRHVARSTWRVAAIWGAVFGIFTVSTAQAYAVAYPTLAERVRAVPSFQSFAMILGQPRHAETVAGFTQWRILIICALIGAVWGMLTSTSVFRGDEETGRWELLLAGPTTQARATAAALRGLGISLVVMICVTALFTLATDRLPSARFGTPGALLFALGLCAGAVMFAAVGAVTSQLAETRGQAIRFAAPILGISFLVRMLADGRSGLGWLRWFSPLGWIEELRPLRDTQVVAFAPMAGLVAGCVAVTLVLAARRDHGHSLIRERPAAPGTPAWLRGPFTLALRNGRSTAIGWLVALAVISFMEGFVARSATALLAQSPNLVAALGRIGLHEASKAFLGISFLLITVILGVLAASQLGGIRDEEASGRLDNLLVRPVPRLAWLLGRLTISLVLIVAAGLDSGVATWLATESQHAGISFSTLVEAGLNACAPAIAVLGVGMLALGFRPRLTGTVGYGIVAYSFLVQIVGSVMKDEWLRDTSLFAHIALAPSAKPDWAEASVLTLCGLAAIAVGAVGFVRRDVEVA